MQTFFAVIGAVSFIICEELQILTLSFHQCLISLCDCFFFFLYCKAGQECIISLCKSDVHSWEPCQDAVLESKLMRGPVNMGPARRVAEGPFLIVTGEHVLLIKKQFCKAVFNYIA